MKYIICELVGTTRYEPDGYSMKSIRSYSLETEECPPDFSSIEEAEEYIKDNHEALKGCKFTIIPFIEVVYN